MDLIPKIGSLARLPELLKKKQEAEEHSKRRQKERERRRDKDPFISHLEDELSLTVDPETLSRLKITLTRGPEEEKPPKDKKLGNSVDLSI